MAVIVEIRLQGRLDLGAGGFHVQLLPVPADDKAAGIVRALEDELLGKGLEINLVETVPDPQGGDEMLPADDSRHLLLDRILVGQDRVPGIAVVDLHPLDLLVEGPGMLQVQRPVEDLEVPGFQQDAVREELRVAGIVRLQDQEAEDGPSFLGLEARFHGRPVLFADGVGLLRVHHVGQAEEGGEKFAVGLVAGGGEARELAAEEHDLVVVGLQRLGVDGTGGVGGAGLIGWPRSLSWFPVNRTIRTGSIPSSS